MWFAFQGCGNEPPPCCDPRTCKLSDGSVCANGPCCSNCNVRAFSFFRRFFSYFLCVWVFCLSTMHVPGPTEARKKCRIPWAWVTDGCKLSCGYWTLNLGSLDKQPMLLTITTEPSLQIQAFSFKECWHLNSVFGICQCFFNITGITLLSFSRLACNFFFQIYYISPF